MDERYLLLDLADLARITAGGSVRCKLKGSYIEVVIWGGCDVQRIANLVRTKTGAARKSEGEKP